jgi:hypothetical protein
MKLYFGDTFLEITANDNSKAIEKVRAVDTLTLYFSMPEYIDIPVGAWTTFEGKRYELLDPKNFKKHNTRNFEYTLVLEDEAGKLRRYKFRDSTTRRLKFEYTARPHEFIKMLVYNLNKREPGWTVGDCIEAVEKVVAFNHTNCHDALEQITDAFGSEWEIENKRISLRKVEYFKDNPLPLSYGMGNGFKSGIGRTNKDKMTPVEILFPQGGNRNIDPSTYGSSELLLPKNQVIGFDGTAFYYDPSEVPPGREVKWYITDADGFSVSRKDKAFITFAEDSLDCSHIYPSRVGTVSEVVTVDAAKNLYDIVDASIPEDLDYTKYLIQGSTLTIIPQDGMLAGKEFDAKYIHADRRFEIVPQDLDGRTMPDEVFKPFVGQKYAVFGMMMPDEYVCDNASHTGASWDMLRECVRFFFDNEEPHFSFTGELNSIWAQEDWLNIGGRIRKGAFILFSDTQFQPDGAVIRIVSVTRPVNTPKKPKIELSNVTVSGSIVGELNKITENEFVSENQYRDALQFAKRRFRDALETIEMLEGAFLHFSESIDPIAVRTMSLLVGDESLQYRFVNNKTNPQVVPYSIAYDATTKQLKCPTGIIQHMTLGIKDISSAHKATDYNFWNLPAFMSARLDDPTKKYYLYIRASATSQSAEFRLSETGIEMNAEAGYYHFLAGMLNSEYDGERSWAKMYGFTEILPGQITVERIISEDGWNFIDFLNNAARIGDDNTYMDWNTRGDRKMRIKGSLFVSDSGDENFPAVFRGEYSTANTYYSGDTVTYTVNGKTSTYRYIYSTPGRGYSPTSTSRWETLSSAGSDGDYYEYRYAKNGSRTSPPSLSVTAAAPSGWSTTMPTIGAMEYIWYTIAKKSATGVLLQNWSTPARHTPYDGIDGKLGPVLVFRGTYDSGATYYGNSKRVDAVKYNGVYYIASVTAPGGTSGFSGRTPVLPSDYWNDFGAQFDSIATNLLLAEGANIGDWFIQGGRIVSTLSNTGNKISLDATKAKILIESAVSGGGYTMDSSLGSVIELDANQGIVGVRAKNSLSYSTGTAYLSPTGIFANLAGTEALPAIYGRTHRAAIVGLGFANVNKSEWEFGADEAIIAGVYGRASNSGTAPAFGGYFWNLKACGMVFNRKYISDREGGSNTATVSLSASDSLVIGLVNSGITKTVYLPTSPVEGQTVFIMQMGAGALRVDTRDGSRIYDDTSENTYYDVPEGYTAMLTFGKWAVTSGSTTTAVNVWCVGRFRF